MSIIKIDLRLVRKGDLIKLNDRDGEPWWYVKELTTDGLKIEENTIFYLKEKKLKINPRRKRYVFCEV